MRRHFEDIEMTDAQAGYLAGMLDGEGWIALGSQRDTRRSSGDNRYHYVMIGVTNTHKPLLDWIQEVTNRGRVHEGSRDHRLGRKPRWMWTCRGWSAADVLRAVRPYLLEKKARADVALEFAAARHRHYSAEGRTLPPEAAADYHHIYEKFKALKEAALSVKGHS